MAASTQRVRVTFLIGSLAAGGSERQLIEMLKLLDRDRFAPYLYSVYGSGALRDEVPADVVLESYWDTRTPPRLNYPGRILRGQARDLAEALRRNETDIICDRNFEMTLLASRSNRHRPTPRLSIVDANPELDVPANCGRFPRLKKRLLCKAYAASDRIVAVSDGVAAGLNTFYGQRFSQCVTIYNFIDSERVDRLAAEEAPPLPPDRFHLIAVGRLQPQKGYIFLLEAMRRLVYENSQRQLFLSIVGDGVLRAELEQRVREWNLCDYVSFVGFERNPMPRMKQSHLYCLPSLYEGMPNVLQEAILCRTPVLATDCPSGPSEILDQGRLGRLVPPRNATALAEAILDAVSNYKDWQDRTEEARKFVVQRFSAREGVREYEQLFWELTQ